MRSRLINDECSTHFLREVLKKNTNILYVFYLAIHEGKTHRVHKKCKQIKGNFLSDPGVPGVRSMGPDVSK